MRDTAILLQKLVEKQDLLENETADMLRAIMNGSITPVQTAALLTALRMKGETVQEIVGLVRAMREHMVAVGGKDAFDVVGTGGDGSGTFNISTTVAFVLAGAGVKVAKHGNRAASSKSGSADVLEALGVNIHLSAKQAEAVLNKIGMVFLFAPLYHPAMKNVTLVRKDLKIRTVFNFLGPFVNPAGVTRQLTGVPNVQIAEKLAQVGKELGYTHLLIVTSDDGMDEISTSAKTTVFTIKNGTLKKSIIDPTLYGFKKSLKKDIIGKDASENAQYLKEILSGAKGPKRDIVVLNSAYALLAAGKALTVEKGIQLAQESIDSGSAKGILDNFIQETKKYA